jgi:hypothetical protein
LPIVIAQVEWNERALWAERRRKSGEANQIPGGKYNESIEEIRFHVD